MSLRHGKNRAPDARGCSVTLISKIWGIIEFQRRHQLVNEGGTGQVTSKMVGMTSDWSGCSPLAVHSTQWNSDSWRAQDISRAAQH